MQLRDDGSERRRKGEWHFGWALEGRAIQDVWIVPPRGELRDGDAAANVNSCRTTLRVYDPRIDAWQIQWTDPVTQNFLTMIGRAQGDDIVQLGTRPDGSLARWSFSEITPNSFRWRGEARPIRARPGVSTLNSRPSASHSTSPPSVIFLTEAEARSPLASPRASGLHRLPRR